MALTFAQKHDAWQGKGKGLVNKPSVALERARAVRLVAAPVTPEILKKLRLQRERHLAQAKRRKWNK